MAERMTFSFVTGLTRTYIPERAPKTDKKAIGVVVTYNALLVELGERAYNLLVDRRMQSLAAHKVYPRTFEVCIRQGLWPHR